MGLSFVGNPNPRHAYKKCVPSLPKDHDWPILVAHATMSICIVSFSAYSAPLCNFIFKNRSITMRTLLIFSLSILRQNRLIMVK